MVEPFVDLSVPDLQEWGRSRDTANKQMTASSKASKKSVDKNCLTMDRSHPDLQEGHPSEKGLRQNGQTSKKSADKMVS